MRGLEQLGLSLDDMGTRLVAAWLRAYTLRDGLGGVCTVEVFDAGANWEAKATRLSDSQVASDLIPKG